MGHEIIVKVARMVGNMIEDHKSRGCDAGGSNGG